MSAQLICADETAAVATYLDNAREQLASRALLAPLTPTGVSQYIYDLDGHLIAEAAGTSAATAVITREYIWLEGMPVAVIDGVNTASPTTYYVHTDHLTRPVRMTDSGRTNVWNARWLPHGGAFSITGSAAQNLRFPGQYFLIEQGLHYNWHRFYDPTTGRYTQPDPLGFPDGPARYAYVINSPLMYTDPEGRFIPALLLWGAGSALFDAGMQYLTKGCVDWWQAAGAGVLGAAGGAGFSAAGTFGHSVKGLSWLNSAKNYGAVSQRVRRFRNAGADKDLHHWGFRTIVGSAR
jgi:RHS repeat-associated protein